MESFEERKKYTTAETIKVLGISRSTFYRWIKEPTLPENPLPRPVYIARNYYIASEVDAWALANRR